MRDGDICISVISASLGGRAVQNIGVDISRYGGYVRAGTRVRYTIQMDGHGMVGNIDSAARGTGASLRRVCSRRANSKRPEQERDISDAAMRMTRCGRIYVVDPENP